MADLPLDVRDDLTGVGLVPAPVQLLGGRAELNDQVAGQVLWLNLAAFFPPQPQQDGLVIPMMIRASEPPMKERRVWQVLVFMGGLMASSQIDMSFPQQPIR